MALAFGSATLINPGQPVQEYLFDIVLDGSTTTATLNLPTGFPSFNTTDVPLGNTTSQGTRDLAAVVFQNTLGGTSAVVRATKIVPNSSNPRTQLDITVSAIGTINQTVKILAKVAANQAR